ncbi:MAG TPA: acyl-CoA thioesterase [Parafilimonas sp.]|nr:acyl-CoA thioesterase [Parafilimonas sp.]
MTDRKTKIPSDSETIKTEVVCPNDTNPMGILKGGRLVEWMDIAAAVCAQIHAGKICVTASIDSVEFKAPAKLGEIIGIKAKVTRAFNSSMEIFVEAYARNATSEKKILVNKAYFTFVALDDEAKPARVPALKPVTEDELEQYNNAIERKRKKQMA